jgi:hydrogenase expression/formation protein HypE
MTMTLPLGKIPIDILKGVVFRNLGAQRKEVLLGPTAGIDGAVLDLGDKSLIVSMDPITAAVERIGWEAVNVNANDVATFGVEPQFLVSCLMFPESSSREIVETITSQMDKAAKALNIAIIGGHCETTPGLANPIVVGCVMGLAEKGKYVTAGGAQAGDMLILTKSAGIEGTAILAYDRAPQLTRVFGAEMLNDARRFYNQISVVKDALVAYRTGGVNAMHDPTEGGVLGGIHEMADASNMGVRVYEDRITVEPETSQICKYFEIDPLQLIGSGALLIAAKSEHAGIIVENLAKEKIFAAVIGEVGGNVNKRLLIQRDGTVRELPRPVSDHLWLALKE